MNQNDEVLIKFYYECIDKYITRMPNSSSNNSVNRVKAEKIAKEYGLEYEDIKDLYEEAKERAKQRKESQKAKERAKQRKESQKAKERAKQSGGIQQDRYTNNINEGRMNIKVKNDDIGSKVILGVIFLALAVFLYSCVSSCGSNHSYGPGKCSICGRKATQSISGTEYCDSCYKDFWKWYYKNN